MPSTYSSNLKLELMATGENSGTWGNITNTNLGTAAEQAIVGLGNVDYVSDANLTISITNSNAAQAARALVLNVTSSLSLTNTRELVVPTIEKQYIVQNNTTGGQSITVKTSAGTGITVPNGRKAHLYVNGTNVIQMFDFVDINGGTIDGATVGANSASTGAFTSLTASGATTLNGAVALGDAAADLITVPGTVNSHVLFTDNLYDIGASGATRPRNLFLAGNATIGGNTTMTGTLTVDSTTDSSSTTTGSIQTDGGLGVAKALFVGTTANIAGAVTLSGGTANGVAYLNGSKVLTTGSALVFDGTNLGIGTTPSFRLDVGGQDGTNIVLRSTGTTAAKFRAYVNSAESGVIGFLNGGGQYFEVAGSEQMRLTSTGLGIGITSPGQKLHVENSVNSSTWTKISNGNSGTGAAAGVLFGTDQGDAGALSQNSSNAGYGTAANAVRLRNLLNAPITFETNNTERMRLDSSGNLGLGTSSPAYRLQVTNTAASNFVSVVSVNTGTAGLLLGDTDSATVGRVEYENLNNAMTFFTNGSERARIDSSGNLGIGGTVNLSAAQSTDGQIRISNTTTRASGNKYGIRFADSSFETNAAIYAEQGGSGNNASALVFGTNGGTGGIALTSATERARITGGGDLLVGTTSGSFSQVSSGNTYAFGVVQTANGNNVLLVDGAYVSGTQNLVVFAKSSTTTGTITYNGTVIAYNTTSDYRLKEDVRPMTGALAKVAALKPVTYKWKSDGSDGEGFIAHELQAVVPHAVTGEKDAVDAEGKPQYQGIDTSFLVATLTAAIQELKADLDATKAELAALKGA